MAPVVVRPETMAPGAGRRLLLVVAHADDVAIFAGGVVALFAGAGWQVHALRVTDDRWDSVGLTEAETIRRNAQEFRAACAHLGCVEATDLGFATDVLGDVSRVALRERIIHAIRRVKPHALMSFDPDSRLFEDNLDHRVLGQAVDEAFWTAMFDKHHPEHFAEGLTPHGTLDRWFFGRVPAEVTHVFDTSSVLDRQMQAVRMHETPIANMARQFTLQARTAGLPSELVASLTADPAAGLIARLTEAAARKGQPHGLAAAEHLRLHAAGIGPALV